MKSYRITGTWWRWLKFNLVGAGGIVVQFVSLWTLSSMLHVNYMVATACAVEAAVLHNYLWHERFTWRDRPTAGPADSVLRLLHFNVTNGAISIVGNLLLMRLLVGQVHLSLLPANAISIVACSLVNFVASDRWVFADSTFPH